MSETTALIPLEAIAQPADLFTSRESLDGLLDRIAGAAQAMLASFDGDRDSDAYRKHCGAVAYKLARSKTTIDEAGKAHVAEIKKRSAAIDQERRRAWDYLESLQRDIRAPLTKYEAEQKRIADEAAAAELQRLQEAEAARLAEIKRREDELAAREAAVRKAEEQARQEEARKEAAARQAAREEEIERNARAKALAEAREAEERAARQKAEEEARAKAAAEKLASNERRREKIRTKAANAIGDVIYDQIPESAQHLALKVVEAIEAGRIPHVSISFA